jgi:hypothetical protein
VESCIVIYLLTTLEASWWSFCSWWCESARAFLSILSFPISHRGTTEFQSFKYPDSEN